MPSIFKAFASRTLLPVHIDEIRDWMLESGAVDEIIFHPLDRDPLSLRGFLCMDKLDKYLRPEANRETRIADIPYSIRLPNEEQRLIKAKELLHIEDAEAVRTDTREKVSQLIEEIVIPPELLVELNKLGFGFLDHAGLLSGLGVLVPLAARNHLAKLFHTDKVISVKRIAEVAEIPEIYVPFVLSDNWGKALERSCEK